MKTGDVKLAFIVTKLPYKSETSRLAITHALSYQTVEVLLEDNQTITPSLIFVDEGVLNCIKNHKSMEHYELTSVETHLKNALLVEMDIYVCKESIEKFGVLPERIVNAEDIGAEKSIKIVSKDEIKEIIKRADHLLYF